MQFLVILYQHYELDILPTSKILNQQTRENDAANDNDRTDPELSTPRRSQQVEHFSGEKLQSLEFKGVQNLAGSSS